MTSSLERIIELLDEALMQRRQPPGIVPITWAYL